MSLSRDYPLRILSEPVRAPASSESAKDAVTQTSFDRLQASDDAVRLAVRLKSSTQSKRLVVFTGAEDRDGVGVVATQVAMALVRMDIGRVLLVDANLRSPSLHGSFGAPKCPGLAEVLAKTVS